MWYETDHLLDDSTFWRIVPHTQSYPRSHLLKKHSHSCGYERYIIKKGSASYFRINTCLVCDTCHGTEWLDHSSLIFWNIYNDPCASCIVLLSLDIHTSPVFIKKVPFRDEMRVLKYLSTAYFSSIVAPCHA